MLHFKSNAAASSYLQYDKGKGSIPLARALVGHHVCIAFMLRWEVSANFRLLKVVKAAASCEKLSASILDPRQDLKRVGAQGRRGCTCDS